MIHVPPRQGSWLSFHGVPVELIITSPQLDLSRGVVQPGFQTPRHSHPFAEGFYVLRGWVDFRVGQRQLRAESGQYLHIAPGSVHQPLACGPQGAELLVFAFPSGFNDFQRAVGQPAPGGEGPFAPPAATDLDRLAAHAARFGIDLNPQGEQGDCHLGDPTRVTPWAVAGDLYRFLAEGEHTGGQYALWHATVPPGAGPPRHRHSRESELFFVLGGQLEFTHEEQRLLAEPGTCLLLSPGTTHRFTNAGDQPAETLILVAPAGLEGLFRETGRDWSGQAALPGPPDHEELERLLSLAPGYGVDILP